MAGSSLINIGLSGVRAHQAALATTGQNITNATVEGYSRQRVDLATQTASGVGAAQNGVRIVAVERIVDEAVNGQLRQDTSARAAFEQLEAQLERIDNLLADEAGNLNRGLERFFDALNSAAAAPSSLPARQLVIAEAESLVARFQGIDGRLRAQRAEVAQDLRDEVDGINELSGQLAAINQRIGPDPARAGSTLLDERDELLRQLAERVDIRVVDQPGSGMSVFVGNGQALVVGGNGTSLRIGEDGQLRVAGAGEAGPTLTPRGGSLGGLLDFRDQQLEPVIAALGTLALGFAGTFNDAHRQGIDLAGRYGGDFFGNLNDESLMAQRLRPVNSQANASAGDLRVAVSDVTQLEATSYRLNFLADPAESFEVRRVSDGATVATGKSNSGRPGTIEFDGLRVELGGGPIRPGASYRIDAAAQGVGDLRVRIQDGRELALANPVTVATGSANQGTGQLAVSRVEDSANALFADEGRLSPPLLVRFTSPTSYDVLDNSDPLNPVPLDPPVWGLPFVPDGRQGLLPEGGQQLVMSGGLDANALARSELRTSTLAPAPNALQPETLSLLREEPGLGGETLLGRVEITAGMSARSVAAALSALPGASAAARTTVTLENLVDNGIGEPVRLGVNGELLTLPPGASLNDLADAITANDALRQAGIEARSDGSRLTLTAALGDDIALHFAGDVSDRLTVTDAGGRSAALRGSGPDGLYGAVTVGGAVRLLVDDGLRLDSDGRLPGGGLFAAAEALGPASLGFQLTMTGRPEAGDSFALDFAADATLDNRNALALANLAIEPRLGDPPVNFSEAYSQIVEGVGLATNQARLDEQAAAGLLEQSVARRESISGVNLEEEAANLIRFEQAYNASARVVAVARDIFTSLLNAIG